MNTYKIKTRITRDGKILLPHYLRKLFDHWIEIVLLDRGEKENLKLKLRIPHYKCSGKVNDFHREELYNDRF